MAKREWNGSARIWGGILGGAVVLAVLLALAVQNFTAQPAGPAQESSMGSESSSLSSGSSSEEESSSQTESGDSSEESSESSSQAEKTDKITITQSGEYAGIDPMKQVVIRTGEVTIRDMTITGDLFIMDEVTGDVTLENVTIEGNLYVYGSDLLTLDSVTVPNARFQRDNQQLNVMVKGDSQIDNTLVMCSATLRERALGRSEGFVNMQVENGGILIKNNISLLSVHLDQLTVNYNSRISLSSGTEIKQADANAKLTLAGLGKVQDLVVRSDYVQYTSGFLCSLGLGSWKFLVQCLYQFCQQFPVLGIAHQQHLLCPLIGQFPGRIGQQPDSRGCGFDQQTVVIDTAHQLPLTVEQIFPHHGPAGDPLQAGELIQNIIPVFLCGCHVSSSSL